MVLEDLLKKNTGDWFLDVGGSFGRNLSRYYNRYQHPVIIDYSLETLIKYQAVISKTYPKTVLIAANAYKLPFKKQVFDGGLMVRVLHHIEKPDAYFKEIYRVLNGQAIYIQEFANKIHFKARLRSILRLDFSIFTLEPYQQPNQGYNEGTRGESTTFLNFHPQYIKNLMADEGFVVKKSIGASFLRLNLFKRLFSTKILTSIERFLQVTTSWMNASPSIFFLTEKPTLKEAIVYKDLYDTLVCPACNGELVFAKDRAICRKCRSKFSQKNGIWDFRTE